MEKGQVVYSKSGHDKGGIFIVTGVGDGYVYIVDGERRKLQKPKKKNIVHIQPTNFVNKEIAKKLNENLYILDADIRKALKEYTDK